MVPTPSKSIDELTHICLPLPYYTHQRQWKDTMNANGYLIFHDSRCKTERADYLV